MEFDLNNWMAENKKVERVLIEHVGEFSPDYLESVLPSAEDALCSEPSLGKARKKIFHIFVECIQNMYHHIEPLDYVKKKYGSSKQGVLLVLKQADGCRIVTGNFIDKKREAQLRARVDELSGLSAEQIKALYLEKVSNSQFSDKGGAGIGIIDIARKTGNQIKYGFYPVVGEPNVVFYSFEVLISV